MLKKSCLLTQACWSALNTSVARLSDYVYLPLNKSYKHNLASVIQHEWECSRTLTQTFFFWGWIKKIKKTLWSLCGYSRVKAQCTAQENYLIHSCYQAVIRAMWGELLFSYHRNNTSFHTSHPTQQLPRSFWLFSTSFCLFLTPHLCLAGLIHLCSLLSIAKKLTYGSLLWHPRLYFAGWGSQWRTRR